MFLLIDKPKGITSHDVIDELRKITGVRKIGHAGTLDPNATGLLIVGISRESTKKLGSLAINTSKTYLAEIVLGEERETDDIEGETRNLGNKELKNKKTIKIRRNTIDNMLTAFVGEQTQMPPIFSAIKIKGKKAYQLARKGKEVQLKSRKITIHSIKLLKYNYPKLEIETEVSSGTYIRSIARDIGRKLRPGAYLSNLRRTKIGKYDIKNSVKLSDLTKKNWKDHAFDIS